MRTKIILAALAVATIALATPAEAANRRQAHHQTVGHHHFSRSAAKVQAYQSPGWVDQAAVPTYPIANSRPQTSKRAASRRATALMAAYQAPEAEKRYQAPSHGEIADNGPDPRPGAWCGWCLRRHLGVPKSAFPPYAYNIARAWLHVGSPAPHGCTGCVAVFSRGSGGHVGLVESWDAGGNPVILSGNFNGGVGTYAHAASRLIGLRWVSGATATSSPEIGQFSAVSHGRHRHAHEHHHRIRFAARRL